MRLERFYENTEILHVNTEPDRCYYLPCDAAGNSEQILLNGVWSFQYFPSVAEAHKTGFAVPKTAQVVLKGKDKTFTTSVSLDKPVRVSLNQLSGTDPIIPLLYEAPGINGAATVSNAAHVAASTSCGSAEDTSSAAGQLKEIDALPAIEGLLCVSPVLYRD